MPPGGQSGVTSTTTFVYGLDLISATDGAGVTSYYLSDGLGSTPALTDGTGAVTDTYSYDVYGAVRARTGATANQFDFAGEQSDHGAQRGLQYLRARHYDPGLGRFLSKDPVPFVSRYAYVLNNPVNLVDPSGRCHDEKRFAHPVSATPSPSAATVIAPEKAPRDACSPPLPALADTGSLWSLSVAAMHWFVRENRAYFTSDQGKECVHNALREMSFYAEQLLEELAFPYLPGWGITGDVPEYLKRRQATWNSCTGGW